MTHTEKVITRRLNSVRKRKSQPKLKGSALSVLRSRSTFLSVLIILCVSSALRFSAQCPSAPNTSLAMLGLTGVNVANGPIYTNVTAGNPDPRWEVNLTNPSTWSGVSAVVFNPPTAFTGSCQVLTANGSTPGDPQWITHPGYNCGVLGNYSCSIVPPANLYFRCTFNLTTPLLAINWQLYSADFIADISVNGVMAYTTNVNPPYPDNRANPFVSLKWCTNWKVGLNEIRVHVKTDPGFSGAGFCQTVGLKVLPWQTSPYLYSCLTGPTFTCTGSPAQYTTPPLGGTTYSWAVPPNGGWNTPVNSPTYNAVAGTTSGLITVGYLTPSANGYQCNSVRSMSVTVPPPLTITASSPTVCTGQNLTLTATGAVNYTWTGPGFGPSLVNPAVISPPAGTSIYTVKGGGTGCVYTKTIPINTFQSPNVSVVSNTPSICSGNCASLTATGNAWQYSISPCGSSPPCQVFITTPITVCPNTTTNFCIIGKSLQGCTTTACTNLLVNPTPVITAVANPAVICAGGSANSVLTASGANPGSYVWSSASGVPAPTNVNPKTVTPPGATTYSVTGSAGGCTASAVVAITTIAAPVINVNPPTICIGIQNTLTATGGNNYIWTFGPGTASTITSASSAVITVTAATPYTVCGTGANSCSSCTTGIINLGTPVPITATNVVLCSNAGPCTTLNATSSATFPVTYTWTSGTSPAVGASVTACPTIATVYTVSASSTFSGCPNSTTMAVTITSNCCSNSTVGLTPLGTAIGGTYANTSYVLANSTTLSSSATFSNAEVWITPDVTITVPNGKTMSLEKTHLFGCGQQMWQGIVIQDGGRIITANTRTLMSMIQDAKVAIDLSNISLTNSSPNPPIDISRIIFNRNHIGIKISGSDPALNFFPLGISGCVFTSRIISYTTYPNPINWPNNDHTATTGALRFPTTPTTGIAQPYGYMAANFPQANLKSPYVNQPAHIGIKIENIGSGPILGNSNLTNNGVEFGQAITAPIGNDFNLFDAIGNGIDIINSGLTTRLNVFQNLQRYPTSNGMFGGIGINHSVTPGAVREDRLDLRGGRNHFWDCHVGVNAYNLYQVWVNNSVFRSTHSVITAFAPLMTTQGDIGVNYQSDHFDFTIMYSEFNNLKKGIQFRTGPVVYLGPIVNGWSFIENYFGAQVTSTTPYTGGNFANTTEYMSEAIDINTSNAASWQPYTFASLITANKINRAFRGISVNGMSDWPVVISTNTILIEDDATFGGYGQYGISVQNNSGNMTVETNTISAVVPWNTPSSQSVSAVYCNNNIGTNSPLVSCNNEWSTTYGFNFDGYNGATVWQGNNMCNNYGGLALTNSGIIGPQGNPSNSNHNMWASFASNALCGNWNSFVAFNQTYCENSNAVSSPLFVQAGPNYNPIFNTSAPSGFQYKTTSPQSLFSAPGHTVDCPPTGGQYGNPPAWRLANGTGIKIAAEEFSDESIRIFPNPTNGNIIISGSKEVLSLRVFDLSGKIVFKDDNVSEGQEALNISDLSPSIYLLELKNPAGNVIRKKLIKTE